MSDVPVVPDAPKNLINLSLLFVPGVYIVLFLAAAVNVLIGLGLIYLVLFFANATNRLPVGILFLLAIGVLYGVYAVLKGLVRTVIRKPSFEPALSVDLSKEAKLKTFIESLCSMMGTGMPESVILHSGPAFFVQQGKLKVFNGTVKGRVLAISFPLLNELTVNELRAILAHEFAHFTGRDTVYSSFVLPVYSGTIESMKEMNAVMRGTSNSDSAIASLPLILPYKGLELYLLLFHKLNMKLSRIREQRADTIAALTCGSKSFSSSLSKVVSLSGVFEGASREHILSGIKENRVFVNYYATFQKDVLPNATDHVKACEKKALEQNEGEYDSHCSLRTRIEYVPNVPEKYSDEEKALTLLADPEDYGKTLTEGYTQYIAVMNGYVRNPKNK